MCGIAGIVGEGAAAEAEVADMLQALSHRGPDGLRVARVGDAVLGHARLSIIDLEGGWQPLTAAGCTVVGNGEIYNYLELIEEHGLACATGSDFEPLLHLYAREGERAFARLRGMYAFCLVGDDGRTWLVRDPFGIKPLWLEPGVDGWRFASERRAWGAGRPALTPEQTRELLALGYVLSPRAEAAPSPERLGPGEAVALVDGPDGVDWDQRDVRLPWLDPPPPPPDPDEPVMRRRRVILNELDAVLEAAVAVHQRADVPYGLFLSGGVDSSVIATLMARLNSRPVTAWTCGFDAPGARDERAGAERVARALDLDWRETTFGEAEFWRVLPLAAAALDDPTTDYACLPTYALAEAARGSLTVVLSGEGGDELFGGYGRYRRALRPWWLGGRAAEPRVDAPELRGGARAPLDAWRGVAAGVVEPWMTPLQRAQAADIATWLPHQLLLKLDRCLMAHGLEGRTPFLDREVAAFAFRLWDGAKVSGRHGKHLLRDWLAKHCPAAEPWSRKRGFTVPVGDWIAPRAAELGPAVAQVEAVRAVCDPERVRAVFAEARWAHRRWPLLFLAVWSRIHQEGAEPEAALRSLLPDL